MNAIDQRIAVLRTKVRAARQEFDLAVTFHELWKPAAYDDDLHKRMGVSSATNAFNVVRAALRREMLLALMRLWDKDGRAIGMQFFASAMREEFVIEALAAQRNIVCETPEFKDEVIQTLS